MGRLINLCMDIFWIRVLSQTGIYATFALYLLVSLRRGPREWIPLVGTVVYAVVFEHFNMLRYAHVRGGYSLPSGLVAVRVERCAAVYSSGVGVHRRHVPLR